MCTNWRSNTPLLANLSILAVLVTTSLLPVQTDPRSSPASGPLQTCTVPDTPYFTEYYGTVTLDGQPAPAGTLVEAYSPRGDRAGCVQVTIPGFYPYMRVYREDLNANPPIPGMRPGDKVTFRVNNQVAQTDPSPVTWTDDMDQHPVNLAATLATCDLAGDGALVTAADIQVEAAHWRQTRGMPYDRDGDNRVRIADLMWYAFRWGQSCA